ncbi:hypothetical protein TSUD_280360 [Trifolium subterraneum]|uniref:RNase H type-1 domain-containing protein n=1 Tax=Trifolium subterraneum TaxID=3900 RepID=A0A2Z6PCL9_TRISU|nr:hypothetical protein TSUD_280360 [Trifolium subterraneum]
MCYPQHRRYPTDREYTPLNRSRVHVLHEILQAGLGPLPPPRMNNKIMGPDTEAWCAYHRCKGHDNERCFRLRDLIKDLIRSGHLRKFLEDAAKGQVALPKQIPYQQKGEVGNSTFPHTPEISFNSEDGRDVIPHDDDPLVIQVQIWSCDVKRVLIDSGSSVDILYWDAYKAMRLSDEQLNTYYDMLVRFSGEQVHVMGHITLYTTFGEEENAKTIKVGYLVVKTPFTSYNIIIGRPSFNILGAVMSTLYMSIKYPLNNGKIRVVKGDQALARKYYESSLKIRHKLSKPVSPPDNGERTNGINMVSITDLDPREEFQDRRVSIIEDLEQVQIGEQPHQTTNVGTSLHPEEKEKIIAILRNNIDLFAWQPSDMPGIDKSNAGATYQRLMDRVFVEQIGKNLEVYIDGMVVKTEKEGEHDKDLDDILKSVRKYNMRLNAAKCSFGVQDGKVLGFLLTHRGIEANLDKYQVIINMRSPTSVKEVQKLTANSSAIQILILFRREGVSFLCHIKEEREALGSALVQEIEGEEKHIYFVSRTLRGAETRYQKIERLCLAVPDLAGRMVAWPVELSEFDITYFPRGAIKSQALADFVLELTDPPSENEARPWTLSVDGSSNLRGSGAGVVMEGPEGVLIKQSLRFAFKASNNQAEYEALITGMKLAKEMEVQELKVQSDSQLVANQVAGEFQSKDPQLTKYLENVKGIAKHFTMFDLTYIAREQSARADLLAKLTSTKKPGNHRTVIQETLKSPSINEVEVGVVIEEED